MKILLVGNHPTVHGGITSVINQIRNHKWKDNDVDIYFLATYKGGTLTEKILYFLKSLREYKKIIKNNSPDIIYIHMSHHGSFDRANYLLKIANRCKIPVIVHLHGSEFKKYYEECSPQKKIVIKHFFENCSSVIVLGEQWKKFVESIAENSKIYVLNNSIHIPNYKVKQMPNEVNILFLGVLIKRKGVEDLLKVAKSIIYDEVINNVNFRFIIGGIGSDKEKLVNYVVENHIENYVDFLGWIEGNDKERVLKSSHIFVLPSYNEGLPVSVLEAMSYGMPIIATDVGSTSEAVINGGNGILIQPGNARELSNALIALISDYELRLKMSQESKRISESKFDEIKYFKELHQIFTDLINK